MRNFILSVIVAFLSFYHAFSQCKPVIPANANVVNQGSIIVDGGFTPQWVCFGDTLNETGGIFKVYLEYGAVMNTNGGIDTIYVKNGATLNMSSGIHVLFYEPSAILNITGGNVMNKTLCSSIQFDYSHAPTNKCLLTTALADEQLESTFTISPNPSNGIFFIRYGSKETSSRIEIRNTIGNIVYETETTNLHDSVDLTALPKGVYFVRISNSGKTITAKLVLEE